MPRREPSDYECVYMYDVLRLFVGLFVFVDRLAQSCCSLLSGLSRLCKQRRVISLSNVSLFVAGDYFTSIVVTKAAGLDGSQTVAYLGSKSGKFMQVPEKLSELTQFNRKSNWPSS